MSAGLWLLHWVQARQTQIADDSMKYGLTMSPCFGINYRAMKRRTLLSASWIQHNASVLRTVTSVLFSDAGCSLIDS